MTAELQTPIPLGTSLEPALDLPDPASDVAGSLDQELVEQRIGEEEATITGVPGISTIHCLTSRTAPFQLPIL